MRTLLDMVKEYQTLLERKDELATLTKENTAAIEAAKLEITQQMIDDDCPRISTGGYTFTLQSKTAYSKRSEAEMAETGADFFSTLREEGLGDIIVEMVNARTLQSTMSAYVEEHGELSEALEAVCREAVEQDGADTILLGCLGIAQYGQPIQEKLGVRVLDPSALSVAWAELCIRTGLRHGPLAYPRYERSL